MATALGNDCVMNYRTKMYGAAVCREIAAALAVGGRTNRMRNRGLKELRDDDDDNPR